MLIFVVLTLFFADSCTEERLRNLCAQAVSLEQHLQQEVRKAEVTTRSFSDASLPHILKPASRTDAFPVAVAKKQIARRSPLVFVIFCNDNCFALSTLMHICNAGAR